VTSLDHVACDIHVFTFKFSGHLCKPIALMSSTAPSSTAPMLEQPSLVKLGSMRSCLAMTVQPWLLRVGLLLKSSNESWKQSRRL
jgi:hypothetical protein